MSTDISWQPTELAPDWLSLTPHEQRVTLLELLRHSPLSRHEQANRMLAAGPVPCDETDAQARVAAVIVYLICGCRAVDRPAATEAG